MIQKYKKGKSAIGQARSTINRILKDIVEDDDIKKKFKKKLAYYICRDLGLICKHMNTDGDWTTGCHRPPRARGLCMKHYQNKYCRICVSEAIERQKGE